MESKNLVNTATNAALASGDKIVKYLGYLADSDIKFKRERDMVTEADRLSEDIIFTKIRQAFPEHDILLEERGLVRGCASDALGYKWVIDPLDGTTNFAHGIPVFAVSISVVHWDTPVIGVIYDPVSRELFCAERGKGAFLNDERIRVSSVNTLCHSVVATGFPYDMSNNKENNIRDFCHVVTEVQGIRRMGVASLDLAYVACGRFDGYWEPGLASWDMAAGTVIVREAGGNVTNYEGGEFKLDGRQIVASNGVIHSELLRLLSANRYYMEE